MPEKVNLLDVKVKYNVGEVIFSIIHAHKIVPFYHRGRQRIH